MRAVMLHVDGLFATDVTQTKHDLSQLLGAIGAFPARIQNNFALNFIQKGIIKR